MAGEMKELIRFQIDNYDDRENMVVALTNAGYIVSVKQI